MIKRGNELGIERVNIEISQIDEILAAAKEYWNMIVEKGTEIRNAELLDLYNQ